MRDIHRRLKPRAPFVAAHANLPSPPEGSDPWWDRFQAPAVAAEAEPAQVALARAANADSDRLFLPEEDEAILRAGGFADAALFFAASTWRGWGGHA